MILLSNQHKRYSKGFTLIEIMVVLVIIGIAAGMLSLSVGGASKYETKSAARSLYGSMSMALEDAVFLNQQIGLKFDVSNEKDELAYTYQWLFYDKQLRQWQPIEREDYQKVDLPAFIELELEIDGQKVTLGGDIKKHEVLVSVEDDNVERHDKKKNKRLWNPDLYFLSSGEVQTFSLSIKDKTSPDGAYIISGDALGQLNFKRPDEQE